jgi:hypothetical protein
MERLLKKKIEDALRRACAPAAAEVLLERVGDHLGGHVVSTRFLGMTPSQRQDLMWKQLDAALTPAEARQISFIAADTPAERDDLANRTHAS